MDKLKEAFSRVMLLLWKNWTIQRRRWKSLIGDAAIPIFIGFFLLFVRYQATIYEETENTIFKPFTPNYIPIYTQSILGNQTNISGLKKIPVQSLKWNIVWSPNHTLVNNVMDDVCKNMNADGFAVEDPAAVEHTMTSPSLKFPFPRNQILAGVIFPQEIVQENRLSDNMNIKIRFPAELRFRGSRPSAILPKNWLTSLIFPIVQLPGPRDPEENEGGLPSYNREGFLRLQQSITSAVLNSKLNKNQTVPNTEIILTRHPASGYIKDPMVVVMQKFLPFLIVISFLFPVKTITEKITSEKERRMKVIMNIMGLSDSLRWTSWFFFSLFNFSVLVIILLLVFKVPIVYGRAILPGSDWSCLFIFFFCYSSSATAFCFLMSTLFSKSGIASTVSGMAWFLLFVPYYIIDDGFANIGFTEKCISSILLNTGMGVGVHIFLSYEGAGPGLTWNNIAKPPTPDDETTVLHALLFIIFDGVLYLLIALYIENVFPGEFGAPKAWYYPFQKSYWVRGKKMDDSGGNMDSYDDIDYPLEREKENLPAGIRIKNLRKVYGKNKKPAIHNLTLNVPKGKVTVLMGFNGAGKTTTLSILTGIYPPTSGTATVAGYNITTDLTEARRNLGFCPQYNVLFDELNTEEHIKFYGKLKGLNKKEIASETAKYIELLHLKDKSKTLSQHLSGGMKRKLSVALAMCGGTKVLILDEPTAGMDPRARRTLWDLVIAEKKDRSILITTHHLDEANLLGDKVAIMSEGRLHCCGSTFFLKKKFSCGYRLKIIKRDGCDIKKITDLVQQNIPGNVVAEDVGMELSYQLPDQHSNKFEQLFGELEKNQENLKIVGFGVTPTTLEDVFLKISEQLAEKSGKRKPTDRDVGETKVKISGLDMFSGNKLLGNQIWAMFFKHIRYSLKSWKLFILLHLIAICGVVNAIFTIRLNDRLLNLPSRDLTITDFHKAMAAVQAGSNCIGSCEALLNSYVNVLERQDVEVRRLDNQNMTEYLLEECKRDSYIYMTRNILATRFDLVQGKGNSVIEISAWFNGIPYHAAPIALSNINDAIFNQFYKRESSILFTNDPLPYRDETKVDIQGLGIDHGFQIAMFVSFSYVFVISAFVLFPIQERETKAKLLQFVTGVGSLTFWSVAYFWNMIMVLGPNLALLITLVSFQEKGFTEPKEIAYSMIILTSFFLGNLPLVYFTSLFVKKPSVGFIAVAFFSVITGIFTLLLVMILRIPTLNLTHVAESLDWVFSLFPLFSMARSFQSMTTASSRVEICKDIYENVCLKVDDFEHFCCKDPKKCPKGECLKWTENYVAWNEPGFGRYLTFLLLVGAFSFISMIFIEEGYLKLVKKMRKKTFAANLEEQSKDSDVNAEREKVEKMQESELQNYNLVVSHVSKRFGKYLAVKNLNLIVKEGECFGLLGANGAGKTTTFRLLTGDEVPTTGSAYIKGHRLSREMRKVRKLIGYCPQFDALLDDLTGREHLRMYCLIRGIHPDDINPVSQQLARALLFEEFLDKKTKKLSGGNKRKLSTAIALVGNPSIVYLDEPTAGIDPLAKRQLWSVINKLRQEGTTIILTSHSMEECEALCTRLTIMVKGEFKCLGTAQYLKNKFCDGYTLSIKLKKPDTGRNKSEKVEIDTTAVERYISTAFPGAELLEKHEEFLEYNLPLAGLTLSKIFGKIESMKDSLNIEDYSLGQTTLEQILLKLTGPQQDEED